MSGQPVYQPAGQPISPSELPQGRKYIGPYWGIVEATTDPLLLGRCRIRVHTVYGDENQTPCNALPWAAPCFPAFFFNPPQVGDAVWVQFQEGDARSASADEALAAYKTASGAANELSDAKSLVCFHW